MVNVGTTAAFPPRPVATGRREGSSPAHATGVEWAGRSGPRTGKAVPWRRTQRDRSRNTDGGGPRSIAGRRGRTSKRRSRGYAMCRRSCTKWAIGDPGSAVGPRVAPGPPLRSLHAALPHRAPALGEWRRSVDLGTVSPLRARGPAHLTCSRVLAPMAISSFRLCVRYLFCCPRSPRPVPFPPPLPPPLGLARVRFPTRRGVLWLRRYYGTVRLPTHVYLGLAAWPSPSGPPADRMNGRLWALPVHGDSVRALVLGPRRVPWRLALDRRQRCCLPLR